MDYSVINFTNITGEDFTGRWDSVDYEIKAGETKPFPVFLAEHFAKQLTDKILLSGSSKRSYNQESIRKPYIDKMLGQVEAKIVEVEEVIEEVKKPTKKTLKKAEEVFEGEIKE